MRDFLDRKILVGDTIVYPHRTRSTMILKKAMVTALAASAIHGINENGRNIVLLHPARCVSMPPGLPSFTIHCSKE